ncbi:DUF3042 family protein [Ligilactobacillus ceti]|uniref:DUF3042 domain-containing protein n=1 Tax=Ligilactobacillus ceti DSM 22408 TaxID=1122146 RepID=A0A0R2KQV0_9LACO|nr:DUF3042 family protein [Ligilactobacillus ceti]KRN88573.1 hypothetical protein IV53_GL000538 [Ligilactobacillus ceti DSM 22408]
MNKFGTGFLMGTLATIGAVTGVVLAFKKTVVEPIEEEAEAYDEHRRRALRKSYSAHQG